LLNPIKSRCHFGLSWPCDLDGFEDGIEGSDTRQFTEVTLER